MLVKDLLIQFFDAYLVRRSLEEALAFLSDDVISLGTGAQEIARNKEELRELMREEFECIPGGFRYVSCSAMSLLPCRTKREGS